MESTDKEAPTVGLSPLQEKRTRDRYSQTVTALLVFTWKASGNSIGFFLVKEAITTRPSQWKALARRCFTSSLSPAHWAKRSRIQSALEQFIALSMLKEHGTFHQPREMTHNIAAVQYAIRLGTMFSWITNINQKKNWKTLTIQPTMLN
ncbi:hypothetical protein PGT21_000505 [Puccinia graminis f. sp. tritici]|uniref:Uncharacterized protein n=1 Tax=Puccinia graminis f. sp. tritici TaxID=56615 RepID=A0A5B0P5R0_PUCGR|nr:hypothetical protein PGT21_000505 [Puccinia graminis f. sp. tritici]